MGIGVLRNAMSSAVSLVALAGTPTLNFIGANAGIDTPNGVAGVTMLTINNPCSGTLTRTGVGRAEFPNAGNTCKWIFKSGYASFPGANRFNGATTGADSLTFDGGGLGIGWASTSTSVILPTGKGIKITSNGAFFGASGGANGLFVQSQITDSTANANGGLTVTTSGPFLSPYNAGGIVVLQNTGTANSYTGFTHAKESGCVIQLGAANQIPDVSVVKTSGGTVDFAGFADTVAGFSGTAGTITLGSAAITLNTTADQSYSGVISGAGSLVKNGTATQALTAANTYSVGTTINAGKVQIGNNTGSSVGTGPVTVSAGGTLFGNGRVSGALTVSGAVGAGTDTAIGLMTNSLHIVLAGGGTNIFNVSDTSGSAGAEPGWDLIRVAKGVNITASSGSKFTVALSSLSGTITNFNKTVVQTWKMIDAVNGLTNFNANSFRITTANIGTTDIGNGSFFVEVLDTTNLAVVYRNTPKITAAPQNANKFVGDTATFSVTAVDDIGNTFTYQWLTNGVAVTGETGSSYTTGALTAADDGMTVSVQVSNAHGTTTSSSATLLIAPNITLQPVGVTNSTTGSAGPTLTVVAEGHSPFTYQWKKDGVNIPSANAASYVVPTIHQAQICGYSVGVTNAAGGLVSLETRVEAGPAILTNPSNLTGAPGDASATFTATAEGSPTLTYQWKQDGTNLTDGVKYSGANSSSLTIFNLVTGDAGNYTVDAINSINTATSTAAHLTIQAAPIFNAQPQSQTVLSNATATFTGAAVAGAAPLSYQWTTNGIPLVNNSHIAGADTATLTVNNATQADATSYVLVVTNSYDTASSSPVTLTVIDPISVTAPVQDQNVVSNNTAVLTVAVVGTSPTYQWKKAGVPLVEGTKYVGVATATLSINALRTTDNATYTVFVNNGTTLKGPEQTSAGAITVFNPIVVATQPINKTVGVGTNATFTISVNGTTPAYQWKRGGTNLVGQITSSLTIAGDHANEDSYSVTVTNFANSVDSSTVTLTVQDVPVITSPLVDQSNYVASAAVFTASASGQSLSYIWKKGSTIISDGTKYSGATTASLTISNLALGDVSAYSLIVSNVAGTATNTANLAVGAPVTLSSAFGSSYSVKIGDSPTLSVNATASPAAAFQWYLNEVAISGATASSYTVSTVSTAKYGQYKCIATNQFGTASVTIDLNGRYTKDWEVNGTTSGTVKNNGDQRSMAAMADGTLLVTDKGATQVRRINGTSGAALTPASLDMTGVTGGSGAVIASVGVAADGAVYACNLVTASTGFRVYRWADGTGVGAPGVAFSGTVTETRVGDRMVVRGSGVNTEILVSGAGGTTALTYLKTTDGVNFTAASLTPTPAMSGDGFGGIIWGTGNKFFTKTISGDQIKEWSYDPTLATATYIGQMDNTIVENNFIAVKKTSGNLLYGFNRTTAEFVLVDASNTNDLRRVSNYKFAVSTTETGTWAGTGGSDQTPNGFAVFRPDSGVLAMKILTAPSITTQPLTQTANAGTTVTLTVAMNTAVVNAQWFKNGVALAGKTSASFVLTGVTQNDAGTYSVIAVSAAGSVLSDNAVLTVNDPFINTQPVSLTKGAGSNAVSAFLQAVQV